MLRINLNCNNRIVTVEAFSFNYTYGHLITYRTTERINKAIFEEVSYPGEWQNSKAVKTIIRRLLF
jgi:hypothetical protein